VKVPVTDACAPRVTASPFYTCRRHKRNFDHLGYRRPTVHPVRVIEASELIAADVFSAVEQTRAASTRTDIIELDEADDRAEIVFGEWLTETLLHGFFCQEENEGAGADTTDAAAVRAELAARRCWGNFPQLFPAQNGEPRR
jgi:hypothetical protein